MPPPRPRRGPARPRDPLPLEGIRAVDGLAVEEILDRVHFGSVIVDRDGTVVYLSQPYAEFLGVDPKAVVGRDVTEVIENTRMHIVVETGEVEIGTQRIRDEEVIVQRVPIRGEDGRIVGAFGQVMFKVHEFHELVGRLRLLESKVAYYEQELRSLRGSRYTFDHIVGDSEGMREAKRLALRAAESRSPVLLLGETGVGKELFAHAIHQASARRARPLVRVSCAAIPRELVESELFGYAPGAFTGVPRRGKPGKVALAHGGSLFLDEIADMGLDLQATLLRVLQEKEVERVGARRPTRVDFRLLAATHEDLEALVASGRFRADLYYRLNVVPIRIPPLRERREDIPALAVHILRRLAEEVGRPPVAVAPAAMRVLQDQPWAGNVREMVNVLERLLHSLDGDRIEASHLPFARAGRSRPGRLRRLLGDQERHAVQQALALTHGNKARAARLLGIHRASLYRKLGRKP